MQLGFNQTIYKKAVAELWGYWEDHTCKSDDCTLDDAYLSKAYDNPQPTPEDIEIVRDNLIMEAEMRGIGDDEVGDDEEGRGEVNLLIDALQKERD